MDVCRYCSTPLGFLHRFMGDGLFCCRGHRVLFQEEYARLAMESLMSGRPAGPPDRREIPVPPGTESTPLALEPPLCPEAMGEFAELTLVDEPVWVLSWPKPVSSARPAPRVLEHFLETLFDCGPVPAMTPFGLSGDCKPAPAPEIRPAVSNAMPARRAAPGVLRDFAVDLPASESALAMRPFGGFDTCNPAAPPARRPAISRGMSVLVRKQHPARQFKPRRTAGLTVRKLEFAGTVAVNGFAAAPAPTLLAIQFPERIDAELPAAGLPRHAAERESLSLPPVRKLDSRAAGLGRQRRTERMPVRLAWLAADLEIAEWPGTAEEAEAVEAAPASDDAFRVTMTLARPKLIREAGSMTSLRNRAWGIYIPRFAASTLRPRVCVGLRPALAHGY